MVTMATTWGMAIGGWMTGWIYDMTGSYQTAFLNGIVWNLMNIARDGAGADAQQAQTGWLAAV